MKKEQVLDLMNAIPPDLIEEANVQSPAKQPLPKLTRTILIAACLCLALLGATGAAQLLGVRILDFGGGYFRLSGKVAYLPYDSLSDQIKALDDQARTIVFPSWQEMEDFIGLDLMDNPVLDGACTTGYTIELGGEKGQHFMLTGYKLCDVSTISCFQLGDVKINLQSRFYTDRMDDLSEGSYNSVSDISLAEGSKTSREAYTAPSGLEAQLLRIDREDDNYHSYMATFSLNSVSFVVQTHSYNSAQDARITLIQVLDGFILK